MNKPLIQNAVILGILSASAIFSYYYFQSHKTAENQQVQENKTAESDSPGKKLPQMKGTKEIGTNDTKSGTQITLEIERTPLEIRSFYKNVLTDRGWLLSKQTDSKDSLIDIYKKDDELVTITISTSNEKVAVVGINFIEN